MDPLKQQLVEISRLCYSRGWAFATSGNYSVRTPQNSIYITGSSKDKSTLHTDDIVEVDLSGSVKKGLRPSAETVLHCAMYQLDARIGAVLHTHSLYATLLSFRSAAEGFLALEGYEMLKALHGVTTHQHREVIPIFPNQQDMQILGADLTSYLQQHPDCHAALVAGHGLYTWGPDLAEAVRHLEALEFLLECEYRKSVYP